MRDLEREIEKSALDVSASEEEIKMQILIEKQIKEA
jgi:hypothetical protein